MLICSNNWENITLHERKDLETQQSTHPIYKVKGVMIK